MITTGCASGLTLAAAAAMAGDSPTFIQQLPNTAGMKHELLIQSNQRYHYDRAFEFSGATLVESGGGDNSTVATAAQLAAAIGRSTAGIIYVAGGSRTGGASYVDKGEVMDFNEVVAVAEKHRLPVLVDAAVEVFPLENMTRWIERGAAVQVMAMKYINAPQSTGVAVGSVDFINRMKLHTFQARIHLHHCTFTWISVVT
jgi:L-seryl-tRNA(Ser) seleniumtransferase